MIPYVREIDVEYGRCDRLTPLIRRVIARNPGPFTYTGTGTYIVGSGEVAVIDPGPELPEHLEALLSALDGERVTDILITHTHADHSPLATPLKALTGATVWGRAAPVLSEGGIELDEAHDDRFRPDRTVADGDLVSGPGWTLRAEPTPGHASNHVCYALLEENALFSGDHVMGWSTTVVSPPDGDMTAYYASLDKVEAGGYATLWPTHGPPIKEPQPFLAAYRAHRLQREAQIEAAVGRGLGRIRDIVPAIYTDVDPRLHPAAAHSVLAHLIHLARQGVVTTTGEPGPDSTYTLSAARAAQG